MRAWSWAPHALIEQWGAAQPYAGTAILVQGDTGVASKIQFFKPGERVPESGIYQVRHAQHAGQHEVTCVGGHTFPTCNHCGDYVTFRLKHRAILVDASRHFVLYGR